MPSHTDNHRRKKLLDSLKGLLHKYCDDTTVHGLHELYYTRTAVTKVFWIIVMILGFAVTIYQIQQVIVDFANSPTKTQISLFSTNGTVKYPPFLIRYRYLVDWIDLQKVEKLGMDIETFFYAAAHFYPIFTSRTFNVTEANRKLGEIMRLHSVPNMHALGLAIALEKGANVVSNESLYPLFDYKGRFHYLAKMDAAFYDKEEFKQFTQHTLDVLGYTNFETSKFNRDFVRIFNRSFLEEYKAFKVSELGTMEENNIILSVPFSFNVVGDVNTYGDIDVTLNDFQYGISGSLYNWIPVPGKQCTENGETMYYVECLRKCGSEYVLFKIASCKLFFIPTNYTVGDANTDNDPSCQLDTALVNSSNLYFPEGTYDDCVKQCLSGCSKWNFKFSQVLYPKEVRKGTDANVTGGIILTYDSKENILVFTLMASTTWYDALANVGGLLGLWIGASIISFFQAVYLFCWGPMESWAQECMLRHRGRKMQRIPSTRYEPPKLIQMPDLLNFYHQPKEADDQFESENRPKSSNSIVPPERVHLHNVSSGKSTSSVSTLSTNNDRKIEMLKSEMNKMKLTISRLGEIIEEINGKIEVNNRNR